MKEEKARIFRLQKRNFFLVISAFFLVLIFFIIIIFYVTPPEIQKIQESHKMAIYEVMTHPTYRYTEWESTRQLLQNAINQDNLQNIPEILENVTLPMFIAFLYKDLEIPLNHLKSISLSLDTSSSPPSILIIKEEHSSTWPFQSFISLELTVNITREKISCSLSRLKKNSQELSTSLTWAYFGSELDYIKKFLSTHVAQEESLSLTDND